MANENRIWILYLLHRVRARWYKIYAINMLNIDREFFGILRLNTIKLIKTKLHLFNNNSFKVCMSKM